MANQMEDDEYNKKIIRGLSQLPGNQLCINCNSLGPQYVCTNFLTFVCTTCSGIHREFTHHVKSVSTARFTSQEVTALQGGGNERAKEVFFKALDSQRHSVPDSSNVERLRDFIKHCYVDRRFTGERSLDKSPRLKMGDKEDSIENRRVDAYRSGSRSPPYEDTNDHHHGERPGPAGLNDERGSPGYGQEARYGDSRKSPIDGWHRSIAPQSTSYVGGATNNQAWNSQARNVQGPLAAIGQPSLSGGFASQLASLEAKCIGREALPEEAMDDIPLPIAQTPMNRRKGKEPIEKPTDVEEEEEESDGEELEVDDDDDDFYEGFDLVGRGRTEDHEDVERQKKLKKFKNSDPAYKFGPNEAASATPTAAPESTCGGRQPNWTEPITSLLLDAWRDLSLLRGKKNQHGMKKIQTDEWIEIAKKVSRESKTTKTVAQCKKILEYLKKKYNQEKMQAEVSTWSFFNQMDILMQLGKPKIRRKQIEGLAKRDIHLALKDINEKDLSFLDVLSPEVYLENLRGLVLRMACGLRPTPVSPTPINSRRPLIPWGNKTILEMIHLKMKEVEGTLKCSSCQAVQRAKIDWREGYLCLASYFLGTLFTVSYNPQWTPPSNDKFYVPCVGCDGKTVPCCSDNGTWDWLFIACTHSICLCPSEVVLGFLREKNIMVSSESSQQKILFSFYISIITQLDPTSGWSLFRP